MTKVSGMLLGRAFFAGLAVFSVLAVLLNAAPVLAAESIAMSGSFYQQGFEIPQGSAISGPDVYVVVFNNSSDQVTVRMTSQTPQGVRLALSQTEFTLPASGQQKIMVGVEVGMDAAPGKYEISIAAEPYKVSGTGIQLVGAASQKASLTVLGDAATVSLQATSPDNRPISATVRLYRVVSGQEREIAYSETGKLIAKVAPGSFIAASFIGGTKVAEEKFDVAKDSIKNVTLSGATVYFEGFDLVPNYQRSDGKLAFVQIVYTVKNLYQRVEQGEVFLQVSCNGASPVEVLLVTLSPLETGRAGLNYNYIPEEGWVDGTYDFKLALNLDGKPYAISLVKNFSVNEGGSAKGDGNGTNIYLIGGMIAASIVLAFVTFLVVRKSRRH